MFRDPELLIELLLGLLAMAAVGWLINVTGEDFGADSWWRCCPLND